MVEFFGRRFSPSDNNVNMEVAEIDLFETYILWILIMFCMNGNINIKLLTINKSKQPQILCSTHIGNSNIGLHASHDTNIGVYHWWYTTFWLKLPVSI